MSISFQLVITYATWVTLFLTIIPLEYQALFLCNKLAMTKKTLTIILFICSTLTACSVMNQQECETANWSALGYVDGSQGTSSSQFSDRSSACSEYNIRANFKEYQAGYNQGLAIYCTENNGFFIGSKGRSYQGVCPQKTVTLFLKGYSKGKELFSLRESVNQAEQDLRDEKNEIAHKKDKLNGLKNSLIYDKLSPRERREKLDEIEEINQRPNLIKEKTQILNKLKSKLVKLESKLKY